MTTSKNEFVDYVVELMKAWATVSVRKMFGGHGLYREGLMFALIVEDELFLKTDADNLARLERAGSHPFVYQKQNKTVQLSYWSAPTASLDSAGEMTEWCRLAYESALRAKAAKPLKGGKK
jgi:DNA transformation protein